LVAIKAPIVGGKDYLEDIAIFTGGKLISRELGFNLETVSPVYVLGKCEKFQSNTQQTIFIKGNSKPD
jgi:hypothetical protein